MNGASMKACKDCKFYRWRFLIPGMGKCVEPHNTEPNLVTGERKLVWDFASTVRFSKSGASCGPDAKWFQPR